MGRLQSIWNGDVDSSGVGVDLLRVVNEELTGRAGLVPPTHRRLPMRCESTDRISRQETVDDAYGVGTEGDRPATDADRGLENGSVVLTAIAE